MSAKNLSALCISNNSRETEALAAIFNSQGWTLNTQVGFDVQRPNAVGRLLRLPINLAFIDLEFPGAMKLIEENRSQRSSLPVVVMAGIDQVEPLRQAMLAGARGFITLPIEPARVIDTISALAQTCCPTAESADAMRIAVASLKGGVGKTTIAANLAVAMQQSRQREVILVEAHHGLSDLAVVLNLYPAHTLAELADDAELDADVVQSLLHRHTSGVRLLAAPSRVDEMVELPAATWRKLLDILARLSSVLIMDTSPTPDAALNECLAFADATLVISSPEMPSLRRALDMMEAIRRDEHVAAQPYLILNRATLPGGISEADFTSAIGERISLSLPYDPSLATFATNRGIPFVTSHPRSRLSQRILSLADLLLPESRVQAVAPSPPTESKRLRLRPSVARLLGQSV